MSETDPRPSISVTPVPYAPAGPPPGKRPWRIAAVVAVAALLVGAGATMAAFVLPGLYHRLNPTEYTFEVSVWLKSDISVADRDAVRSGLAGIETVDGVRYESREQAYERLKRLFEDSPELVESVTPDLLPESFYFETERAEFDCGILDPVADLPAVDDITVMKVSIETSPPRTPVECG
ncbi:hypothetical protein Voc01_097720 [Virgisporangium ochraceum]|uniref:FtsX extracellular domain-containing protein n=1 Tax=Virgisporangium ochraceum TaxID=65505 RepID=A0A8J4A7M6_9ACTN|nr:hypothetical protein Voc01_097720 [Virgisporangium ochraceum]